MFPSVAGEDWATVATSATLPAATVTFTPPEDSGLETAVWDDLAGDGAREFVFAQPGLWTVTLTFADSTTQTAVINVQSAGFIVTVH